MGILNLLDLSPISTSLCVLAFAAVGGLIYRQFSPKKRLDLPYFSPDSSLVSMLEEAHEKVWAILPKFRNNPLTTPSIRNLRLLFQCQEWT